MYEEYLAHFGVKGMKWGVRKKRDLSKKLGSDEGRFGKKGANRIQKYKAKGMSRTEAVQKVARQTIAKRLIGSIVLAGASGVAAYEVASGQAVKHISDFISAGKNEATRILTKAKGIRFDEIGSYYDPGKDILGKILRR